MIEIGRVCVKTAGRDAGKYCVVVDIKDRTAEVDGQTRRRKVNMAHLEPTKDKVDVKKGASFADVQKALKKLGHECRETKPRKAGKKPTKQRKQHNKKSAKSAKKEAKKEEPKAEPAKEPKAEKKAEPAKK